MEKENIRGKRYKEENGICLKINLSKMCKVFIEKILKFYKVYKGRFVLIERCFILWVKDLVF